MTDRTEQEEWEDAELLPDMTTDARRWFLAERARRKRARAAPPTPSTAPSGSRSTSHPSR